MIKAVIFDMDGVLVDSLDAGVKFFGDILEKAGYRKPTKSEMEAMFHMNRKDILKTIAKTDSDKEIDRIMEVSETVEYPEYLLSTSDEVKKVVEDLSKKYPLAVVTTRMRKTTESCFNVSGLKKFFNVIVSYEDTEKHKPNPEPLLFAVERLGIKPSEAVYIGDMESDMKAAKSAGMKIIIYSKKAINGADYNTESFKKIPVIIEN